MKSEKRITRLVAPKKKAPPFHAARGDALHLVDIQIEALIFGCHGRLDGAEDNSPSLPVPSLEEVGGHVGPGGDTLAGAGGWGRWCGLC